MIRTETKEIGENYNPYNHIALHVNRTKRNYVGDCFMDKYVYIYYKDRIIIYLFIKLFLCEKFDII